MTYFTINELVSSATAARLGIDNTPSEEVIANLTALVDNVLDPLRIDYGAPIHVNSGYRCAALNAAVHGAKRSQHMSGQAADITTGNRHTNKELLMQLLSLKRFGILSFDQLIAEHCDRLGYPAWLHVSFVSHAKNRNLLLKT